MNTRNKPQHPGAYLAEIQPGLMTKTALAAKLNMSRTTLWKLMKGEVPLDPGLAARLGDITGDGAAFWLKLQHAWDLWQAERTS
jgi:addiction module HigA family antidote